MRYLPLESKYKNIIDKNEKWLIDKEEFINDKYLDYWKILKDSTIEKPVKKEVDKKKISQSIENLRKKFQEEAFNGKNSFSITVAKLSEIIYPNCEKEVFLWCSKNTIKIALHSDVYEFSWEN